MQDRKSNFAVEIVLLGLLALLWGSSYLFIRIALDTIPPLTLVAIRVSIAALFLLGVVKWQGNRFPKAGAIWRRLWVQAFLINIGGWTVLIWGQQYVDSGLASVLNSTSPIFVFLMTFFLTRHEPTHLLKLFGAGCGVLGVTLIVGADVLAGLGQQVVAQLAILLGAVLYAGAAIYGRRFADLPPTVTAASTMVLATLCLVPVSVFFEQPWTLRPSAASMAAALALAVFCTGVALLIYYRLVNTLGSMGVASQSYLRAGIGVALGVIVLGEELTAVVGLGVLAAIFGVALINWPRRSRVG